MGGETSVALPSLLRAFALTPARASLLISIRFAGGVIAGLALLALGDRVSYRRVITWAATLVLVSAALLPFANAYVPIVIISSLRGPALTMLIATSNGALAGWFRRHPGKWSSRIHSLYGLGLILAPALGFAFLRLGLSWKIIWTIPAAIAIPMLYMTRRLPAGRKPRGAVSCDDCGSETASLPLSSWVLILGLAGITVGTEATIVGWTATYTALLPGRHIPAEFFSLAIAVGIFLGRRITSRVSVRTGSAPAHEASIAAISLLALVMLIIAGIRLVAAALLGFAMSAMYPLMVARLGIFAQRSAGRLYPAVELAASTGGTVIPLIVGIGSGYSTVLAFPLFLAAAGPVLLFFSFRLRAAHNQFRVNRGRAE